MTKPDANQKRRAGVLLHPTSLPGPHGVGSLGDQARSFLDWLARAGVTLWQVLPLVPPGAGNAPYATTSAFSGNPWLLNLQELAAEGLLDAVDLADPGLPTAAVDYGAVYRFKGVRLRRATARLLASRGSLRDALAEYRERETWAEEAALFTALKGAHQQRSWVEWPAPLRDREPEALSAAQTELGSEIDHQIALQFLFDRQWQRLRAYGRDRGIQVVGDIPIYVDHDSVDVWGNRGQFRLDPDGRPLAVAGVPPDYFSDTGQLWGNPLYRWDEMARDGYTWWVARLTRLLAQVDIIRIDHFRAFADYWEVPSGAPDARGGTWVRGPGKGFFDAMRSALGALPLIAEDLGMIDDAVRDLRDEVGLPGMCVLQFAFANDARNLFLPHNHAHNSVAYTGTHDNDTTRGWYASVPEHIRDQVRRYYAVSGSDIAWDLIRSAMASVAHTAVVPIQDILELGTDGRMNTPGVADGNWTWRMQPGATADWRADRLRSLIELYDRRPRG